MSSATTRCLRIEFLARTRERERALMPSLRELLSAHASLLVIDSASSVIQVGLLRANTEPVWRQSSDEASVAVFSCAQEVLAAAGCALREVEAFAFCQGPGSVLSIRTAAVALRTWNVQRARPIYAFGSLELVAIFQLHEGRPPPFSAIADARRETWHCVQVGESRAPSPLCRVTPDTLQPPLLMPQSFRHWAPRPGAVELVPYDMASMFARVSEAAVFHAMPAPDAFLHEEPTYRTWTPQVHQARS